jgi:hypothetical protein
LMLGIFPIVREDGLDWAKKLLPGQHEADNTLGFTQLCFRCEVTGPSTRKCLPFPIGQAISVVGRDLPKTCLVMLEISGMPAQMHHGETYALQGSSS